MRQEESLRVAPVIEVPPLSEWQNTYVSSSKCNLQIRSSNFVMLTKEASPRVAHTITFHPNLCPTDEGSISSLHFHFSSRWLFIMFICFFCRGTKETKDQAWKSKAQKLSQNSIPRPEPFAFQAQLAKYCHFVFSLFFMLFNLRAVIRISNYRTLVFTRHTALLTIHDSPFTTNLFIMRH
jgi:hypothetical protein